MEFARRVGCDHSTASRYRSGERLPSMRQLCAIFAAFDVKPNDQANVLKLLSPHSMSLDDRRDLFGAWLRQHIFSIPNTESQKKPAAA